MGQSRSKRQLNEELGIQGSLAGIEALGAPAWMVRALDPTTDTLNNQTIHTTSRSLAEGGPELLFPTVRMREGGLEKIENEDDAFRESLQRQDFITLQNPTQATAFSQELSAEIDRRRKKK